MQFNCGLSKVQIMFFYLNLRLSCERYRKNMVRAWTKILWWMGIRSTFLMGEPFLLTLLWLNSLSRLHKAICIYTGAVVHPFWSWHFHHSVFYSFVCYVHYAVSKTYHLYQCRYNLCLVYKHVVDKPRRLYVCHANAEIVGWQCTHP